MSQELDAPDFGRYRAESRNLDIERVLRQGNGTGTVTIEIQRLGTFVLAGAIDEALKDRNCIYADQHVSQDRAKRTQLRLVQVTALVHDFDLLAINVAIHQKPAETARHFVITIT